MELKVKRLTPDAILPHRAHPGDAGLDLCSNEACILPAGKSRVVKTGIAIELLPATEGQVRPRSGLAAKHQITVLNAPGTIDEGYRGEIGVILINHSQTDFSIEKGMKIAQLVIKPVIEADICEVQTLSDTHRSTGGFGSTGYKAVTPPN